VPSGQDIVPGVFLFGEKSVFSKLERREIYDILLERVERILESMNDWGKAARESAWRIAVEFWLQSRGFIKVHTPKKCHPISPLFSLMNRSVYTEGADFGRARLIDPIDGPAVQVGNDTPLTFPFTGLKVAVPVMSKGAETVPMGLVILTVGILSMLNFDWVKAIAPPP